MKLVTLGIKIEITLTVVVALVIFLMPAIANATTWYVSPDGDDTNDGSELNPWRTIQHAVDQVTDGDIIKVMDDDDESTDDYVENTTVYKSLTIERYNDIGANPQVKASSEDNHVFHVTANNVTIEGLDIYGSTGTYNAGIYLNQVNGCIIQSNRCGWDSGHKNYFGISLDYSSNSNTLSGNTCESNNGSGIDLNLWSNNNTLVGNTCSSNNGGISLYASSNNILSDNICSNGSFGISLDYSSNSNTLSGNTCNSNNGSGIDLNFWSNNNTLVGNTCSSNGSFGIELYSASNNTFSGNTMTDNRWNFGISGFGAADFRQDMDTSNTVDGKPVYYLVDEQDVVVDSSSNAGYVAVVSSSNITVRDLTLKNNGQGVLFAFTHGSQIESVTVEENQDGISLDYSSDNTISGNTCDSNNYEGIYLRDSSNNTLVGNTCSNNSSYGIDLYSWSNNNTLVGNTCNSNIYHGIYLHSSSNSTVLGNTCNSNGSIGIYSLSNNTILGNTCSNNYDGIALSSSSNSTVSGNTCNLNIRYGISLDYSSDNIIYLNNFSNNATNVDSYNSTNTWHSPTKVSYLYGSSTQTYKSYMGNYYSDYTGSDGDNDGIGDSPYDLPSDEPNDEYPLMETTDNYALQTWWLANPIMYRGDMSRPGGTVMISGGSYQIWAADQPTLMDISFGVGNQAEGTTWTGQVTFASEPAIGDTFTLEIGYADDQNGTNFMAEGPDTTISGDDSTEVFIFITDAVSFNVPQDKYFAMKITNNSGSDYSVRVGGSWSYVAAPIGSQDYSLPVELSSFTATASGSQVILRWRTESEINNLGFNVYRSDTKEGAYTRVNTRRIPGAGTDATPHDYEFTDEQVVFGKTYYYYIEDIDFTGKTNKSHIIEVTVGKEAKTMFLIPPKFALLQNFPNPFNPDTWIPYQLSKSATVTIRIYNVSGQLVRTLYLGTKPAGFYLIKDNAAYWDGRDSFGEKVASGVYFYTLQVREAIPNIRAGEFRATRKMVLLK